MEDHTILRQTPHTQPIHLPVMLPTLFIFMLLSASSPAACLHIMHGEAGHVAGAVPGVQQVTEMLGTGLVNLLHIQLEEVAELFCLFELALHQQLCQPGEGRRDAFNAGNGGRVRHLLL